MVPLRGAASFVGATVRPSSERGAVTISGNGKMARVSDGRNFVPVEGSLVLLQSPAKLVGDEWFVPLDFLTKVLPVLSSDAVAFRARERLLILGADFPHVEIRARRAPRFTRVVLDSDRPVPLEIEESRDAIRVTLQTPFLHTKFREEANIDDVVDRITLEPLEPVGEGYVMTVYLGDRFGRLETDRSGSGVVLNLVRSRVPTRTTRKTDEVPWDLAEQEVGEENAQETIEPGEEGVDEGDEGDESLNPNAEVIELPEDYHLPPQPPELPGEPGGPPELRIVTLDPGHGGTETGAEGHGGSVEKNVVLSIARRFRKILQERLGVRVILTRDGDRELSLDERAAIANTNKSNLFVSIHADASTRQNARGSSVYFLSYSSTVQNPAAGGGDLDFILWDMAQASHLSQSSKLAEILQEELRAITGGERINRGIKQNKFRVLKGATMPAVLVEVGFISNPDEEKLLTSADYQDKLAEALYRGILRYKDLFESGGAPDRTRRSQR